MKRAFYYLTLAAILLSGCTKPLYKQAVESDGTSMARPEAKSLIDTKAEYLYVPSSLYSTRTTDATFPMYQGEAKIVKLSFDENSIQVVEIDPESQFAGNPVNNKAVLSIPVTHLDYKCSLDAYGNCTNRQELDNSKPWDARSYMQLQPDRFAVQEVNFLPVDIANLFYPCYQVVGSNFLSYKLEKDALNLDVEKIYKTDISNKKCAGNLKNLDDISFSVIYHYSLVKLNTLVTASYKPFNYSRTEESTFGFFDTETLKLGSDNNQGQNGEKLFLNRWNPEKTSLKYYLTSNFNKPENAKVKAATIAAVDNINRSLELAGAKFKIDLKDADDSFNPGDLRNSSIILVEDPVNYGILGYGPTAANPRTGEIVKGHVAMYLGVMKETVQRAYGDLLNEKKPSVAQAQAKAKQVIDSATGSISLVSSSEGKLTMGTEIIKDFETMAKYNLSPVPNDEATDDSGSSVVAGPSAPPAAAAKLSLSQINDAQVAVSKLNFHKVTLREIENLQDNDLARDQIMSLNCYYSAEAGDVERSIESEIDQVLKDVDYKPWLELSEDERAKIIDVIMPFLWIPTLTHELGHNLGLRHNFAGSEDKDNFYTDEELKQMGLNRKFAYSSVMDYGYHSNKELQVMGKYDIAALRFGYAEKVEVVDQKTKAVSVIDLADFRSKPSLTLKPYKFCTDEHVDVNPNCKRFDEGTSLVEITQHWLNYYEDTYRNRNFRNGLHDFSLFDDSKSISRIQGLLFNMRMIFERYNDIKNTYGLSDNSPEWAKYAFLKDLKTATVAAANFFVSILQTPDTLCAAAQTSDPNKIVAVVPLRAISTNAISCFDKENVQIPAQFTIVGEGGRSFQSKKDPKSENHYADQIDIRGVWLNKLLAAKMLTMRKTGVSLYDTFTDNFLDMADVKEKVQKALSDILLDETIAPVTIYTQSGQAIQAPLQVKMYNSKRALNTHTIMNPVDPSVRAAFSLPNDNVEFQVQIAKFLKQDLPSQEQKDDATSLLNAIQVRTWLPINEDPKNYLFANVGIDTFVVNKRSVVGASIVKDSAAVDILSKLSDEKLQTIVENVTAGKKAPADATADEKAAYAVGKERLLKFANGVLSDKPFYNLMLRTLAQ